MVVKLEPGQAAKVMGKVKVNGDLRLFSTMTLVVARKHVEIDTTAPYYVGGSAETDTGAIVEPADPACAAGKCMGVVYV